MFWLASPGRLSWILHWSFKKKSIINAGNVLIFVQVGKVNLTSLYNCIVCPYMEAWGTDTFGGKDHERRWIPMMSTKGQSNCGPLTLNSYRQRKVYLHTWICPLSSASEWETHLFSQHTGYIFLEELKDSSYAGLLGHRQTDFVLRVRVKTTECTFYSMHFYALLRIKRI